MVDLQRTNDKKQKAGLQTFLNRENCQILQYD